MAQWPAILLVTIASAGLPLQALINGRLGGSLGNAVWAAVASFVVGLLGLLAFQLLTRTPAPALAQASLVPWWGWLGGLFGAFYIAGAAFAVPRIGAGALIALAVLAQLLAGLVLDHFGVLHTAQPLSWLRALGALLLLAGAWLIVRP